MFFKRNADRTYFIFILCLQLPLKHLVFLNYDIKSHINYIFNNVNSAHCAYNAMSIFPTEPSGSLQIKFYGNLQIHSKVWILLQVKVCVDCQELFCKQQPYWHWKMSFQTTPWAMNKWKKARSLSTIAS